MPAIAVRSLDPFFKPESVAVVGASTASGSVGSILTRNLIENPFGGVIYPINPSIAPGPEPAAVMTELELT